MTRRLFATLAVGIGLVGCATDPDDASGTQPRPPSTTVAASSPAPSAPPTAAASPNLPTVPVPPEVPLDATKPVLASVVTPAVVAQAEALVEEMKRERFPYEVANDKGNAIALLHLANDAESPIVAAAALKAMRHGHARKESDADRAVDEAYHQVVAYRLGSREPLVQQAALLAAAASTTAEARSSRVVDLLLSVAFHHPHDRARLLALDALADIRSPTGPVQDAFLHTLDRGSTLLVAATLPKMFAIANDFTRMSAFRARLVALTKHQEPGIRGGAARILASSADLDEERRRETGAILMPMLEDPHPFVRSSVVDALGMIRHLPAVARIVERVDSLERDVLKLDGWANLDGSRARLILSAGVGDTEGKVALLALKIITARKPYAFEGDPRVQDQAATEAKAWFAEHAEELH